MRIVLGGFRGEARVSDLRRREGIRPNVYYAWLKECMEAGKERLQADMTAGSLSEVVQEAVEAMGMTEVPLRDRTSLLSDKGPGYLSRAFGRYLWLLGIRHIVASPYHPRRTASWSATGGDRQRNAGGCLLGLASGHPAPGGEGQREDAIATQRLPPSWQGARERPKVSQKR